MLSQVSLPSPYLYIRLSGCWMTPLHDLLCLFAGIVEVVHVVLSDVLTRPVLCRHSTLLRQQISGSIARKEKTLSWERCGLWGGKRIQKRGRDAMLNLFTDQNCASCHLEVWCCHLGFWRDLGLNHYSHFLFSKQHLTIYAFETPSLLRSRKTQHKKDRKTQCLHGQIFFMEKLHCFHDLPP